MSLLISCEAGGQRIPAWLVGGVATTTVQTRERRSERTSRSMMVAGKKLQAGKLPMRIPGDLSASYVARRMAKTLGVELVHNQFSDHLIDVTRSLRHRQLFPIGTRSWSDEMKERLITEVYVPYRESLRNTIAVKLQRDPYVVHLSIRTFEPTSKGKPRRADVGLLYDTSVDDEVDFCLDWIDEMYEDAPMLRVRRNYPRRGTTQGVTHAMRTEFAGAHYLGIEVLLNRAWADREVKLREEAIDGMCDTLKQIMHHEQSEAA